MPFDFTTPQTSASHAERVRQVLGPHGGHWIKGKGYDGTRRCLGNAIRETENGDGRALELMVKGIVRARGYGSIPQFNDALSTTFADVVAVLVEAEARAKAGIAAAPRRRLSWIFCWH
jgi:hypothetical protein